MTRTKPRNTPDVPDTVKVVPDPAFVADVKCLLSRDAFVRITELPRQDAVAFLQGKPIRKDRLELAKRRFYGSLDSGNGPVIMDTTGPWLARRLTAAADVIQAAGDRLYISPHQRAYCLFPPKSAFRHACEAIEELVDALCALHDMNPGLEKCVYANAPDARRVVKKRYEALTGRSWYGSSRVHNRRLSKVQGDAKNGELGAKEGGPSVQPADERPGQPSGGEVQD